MALVAVSSIVVDLSTAGSPAATLRPFAQLAARIMLSCEAFGANAATAAYDRAYLLRSFLSNRERYRQDSHIASARGIIDQVIARDPSDEVRPNAVMDHITEPTDHTLHGVGYESAWLNPRRALVVKLKFGSNI